MGAAALAAGLFGFGEKLIEKLFPDPAQRDRARLELLALTQAGEADIISAKMQAVVAEAQGDSWLQRNWRPLTMLCFVAVIVNNYMLTPWFAAFGLPYVMMELPGDVWTVIQVGLGGYVIGRSGEKIAESVADALKKKL